jgi:predicted PurR-regulated permease PerM
MNQSKSSLITFVVLLLVTVGFSLVMISPFLPYIIMGAILAILSGPLNRNFQHRGLRPRLAAALVIIFVFLIVAGPFWFFISRAVDQGIAFSEKIAESDALSVTNLADRLRSWPYAHYILGDPAGFETHVKSLLSEAGHALSAFFLAQVGNLPEFVLHLVVALVTCFVFLTDGGRFTRWIGAKIPLDQDIRLRLIDSFRNTSMSVIWATVAAAGAQAVVMLIAFLITGTPAAFLAAGATFVIAWIPLVGSSPVWIIGAVYLLIQHFYGRMVAMILLGLFAGIVDNIVRPIVLKGRSDMHPLVSLIAVFGGIRMFGILGIFFGPIIAALVIAMLQVWPAVGKRLGFTFDQEAEDLKPSAQN